jgi:hypothetical protein
VGEGAGEPRDDDVAGEHAPAGHEEEETPAETVDGEGGGDGNDQIPDLKEARYHGLVGDVCDADGLEDGGEVVGYDADAVPLGEDSQGDTDENAVAVAFRL